MTRKRRSNAMNAIRVFTGGEPTLAKRNGIHVSPKAFIGDAFANEDAEMDTEEWKEEECEEGRAIAGQIAVYKPSKEEWDAHQRVHIPFRKWCPHCVRVGP